MKVVCKFTSGTGERKDGIVVKQLENGLCRVRRFQSTDTWPFNVSTWCQGIPRAVLDMATEDVAEICYSSIMAVSSDCIKGGQVGWCSGMTGVIAIRGAWEDGIVRNLNAAELAMFSVLRPGLSVEENHMLRSYKDRVNISRTMYDGLKTSRVSILV